MVGEGDQEARGPSEAGLPLSLVNLTQGSAPVKHKAVQITTTPPVQSAVREGSLSPPVLSTPKKRKATDLEDGNSTLSVPVSGSC